MGKPLTAVMRTDDVACRAGDASQREGRPWGVGPDALLDESPGRLDGIEIVRVGRQVAHGGAPLFDQRADFRGFVRLQIVEQDDITRTQARPEAAAHPLDEARLRHRAPLRAEGQPPVATDGADDREIVAPVHRPRLHVFLPPLNPRVGSAHRDVRPGFIEKDQTFRIDVAHPPQERGAPGLDVRSVDFARPRPFF